ncbi:MAG: transcription antitermination factor NusB [bacterium]|nr:transcription antitermination factor NusB [bacterium]
MRKRRKSRILALWMLYSMEMAQGSEVSEAQRVFTMCDHRADPAAEAYAVELARGVWAHREELDRLIQAHAQNWALGRMAVVDRQIMRIALYELLYVHTPPAVCINEAVDIAKLFSTAESGHFVNGVLDAVRRACAIPSRRRDEASA